MMVMVAAADIAVHLLCAEHHSTWFPYVQADSPLPVSCYLFSIVTSVGSTEPTECCRLKSPSALSLRQREQPEGME